MDKSNYKNPIYFEYLAWALLIGIILLPMIYYQQLPDQIPSHFNLKGEPDAYSNKSSIWILPIIGIALFFLLHFLSRAKKLKVNYPGNLSPAGEAYKELIGRKLLNALKIVIPAAFLYIIYHTISVAQGNATGLGAYFNYIFIAVIFGVIFYFIIQMGKAPK